MFNIKHKKWFEDVKVEDLDPTKYIGKFVDVTDDHGRRIKIEIERIVGSAVPKHFNKWEINGKYLITFIDFYNQMNGGKIEQKDIDAFNDMVCAVVTKNTNYATRYIPGRDEEKVWRPEVRPFNLKRQL